jgi:hypothetical protein
MYTHFCKPTSATEPMVYMPSQNYSMQFGNKYKIPETIGYTAH